MWKKKMWRKNSKKHAKVHQKRQNFEDTHIQILFIKHLLKWRKRNYLCDIMKLQILSSQSKEFFCAINCCSYNTYDFHKKFSSKIFSRKNFRIVFAFFRETFRSLQTLVGKLPLEPIHLGNTLWEST